MTTMSRLDRISPAQRRALVLGIVGAILLALAVPIGLTTLAGRSGSEATSSGATFGSPDASDNSSRSPGSASESGAQSGAPQEGKAQARSDAATPAGPAAGTAADLGTKIARSAWLGIEVADLTAASAQVRSITAAADGEILSENVVTAADPTGGVAQGPTYDKSGPDVVPVGIDQARISVSVPAEKLDPVLIELARLGTVSYRSSQSQDVTTTYVDTQARITTMQAGVDSIRALLVKATSLDQVISIETELTRRQADLDSLKAQLTSLDRRTTMSDVTVTLWTAATTPVNPTQDNAFISSIKTAWGAFLSSVAVIVTGLAVLAPWILIALVLIFPVRRLVRRRGTRNATPPTEPAKDPGSAGSAGSVGSSAVPPGTH